MTASHFTAHRLINKSIGNTASSKSFGSKLGNIAGQALIGGALGIAGRGFARGAVHAGRAAIYAGARRLAGRAAQAVARPAIRRAMGA